MKILSRNIGIFVILILLFSVQNNSGTSIEDPAITEEGLTLPPAIQTKTINYLDFDDISGNVGSQYSGVTFSPGYTVWFTTSTIYPPYAGSAANAYTHETDNWIEFDSPQSYFSAHFSSGSAVDVDVVAYALDGSEIGRDTFPGEAKNHLLELAFTTNAIHRIVLEGPAGFESTWTVDHVGFGIDESNYILQGPLIFEDLVGGSYVANQYSGVTFSSGYTVWYTTSSIYPPFNGTAANAYTYELNNNITFATPQSYYSAYYSTGFDGTLTITAYDQFDNALASQLVVAQANNSRVVFTLETHSISYIVTSGEAGFNSQWTIDHITFGQNAVGYVSVDPIVFEDLPDSTLVGDSYPYVTFSLGYTVWYTTSPSFLPYNGTPANAYTHEIDNSIQFHNAVGYYSAYYSTPFTTAITVSAFDASGNLVAQSSIPASSVNYHIVFDMGADIIGSIVLSGDTGFNTQWTVDQISFGRVGGFPLDQFTATVSLDYLDTVEAMEADYFGFYVESNYESGTYDVYFDGMLLDSAEWLNETWYDYDFIENVGSYNITILVSNPNGPSVRAEFIIDVIDTTQPELFDVRLPESYVEGSTGNTISLTLYDANPGSVSIQFYYDGVLAEEILIEGWTNNEVISENIDGLRAGLYEVDLRISDAYGNSLDVTYTLEVIAETTTTTSTITSSTSTTGTSTSTSSTSTSSTTPTRTSTSEPTTSETQTSEPNNNSETPQLELPFSTFSFILGFIALGIPMYMRRRH